MPVNLNISVINRSHQDPAAFAPVSRFEADCQNASDLGSNAVRAATDLNSIVKGPDVAPDFTWIDSAIKTLCEYRLDLLLALDPRLPLTDAQGAPTAWSKAVQGQPASPIGLHPALWKSSRDALTSTIKRLADGLAAGGRTLRVQLLNEAGNGGNQEVAFALPWDSEGTWSYWAHKWLDEFVGALTFPVKLLGPSLEAANEASIQQEINSCYRIRPDWLQACEAVTSNCHVSAPESAKFTSKLALLEPIEQITGKPLILTESGISSLGVDSTLKALPADWEVTLAGHQLGLWLAHEAQNREVFFFGSTDTSDTPDLNTKGLCRRDGTRGPGFFSIWNHLHPAPTAPATQAYKPVAASGAPTPA